MLENTKNKATDTQRGNMAMIALAALVVVGIGATAYFTGIIGGPKNQPDDAAQMAAGQEAGTEVSAPATAEAAADVQPAASDAAAESKAPIEISPGNPVVAKIGDQNVTRADVLNFIQTLSPEARQMPVDKLFPLATEQLINAELINQKLKDVNLESDPLVKEEMKAAKQQIVRSVFMQKEADKALTDEVLQKAYEDFKKNFPNIDEIKARHILVKDEAQAKDLIKKLKDGGDFAALAKEFSIDGTKDKGGELNYFAKQEVVPEFGDAVFAMKPKDVSSKPVKSPFGYHVIEVLDMRKRQPPAFADAKPFLASQLRGQALNAVVSKWRSEAKVEIFDVNGNPVKDAPAKAEDKKG
jgi:peptidyl-prolyl cis-trans isomerase C